MSRPTDSARTTNPWLVWLGRLAFLALGAGLVMTVSASAGPVSGAWQDFLLLGPVIVMVGLVLLVAWLVTGAITWQLRQRGD